MVKVHERSAKKLKNGHYVATRGRDVVDYAHSNRGYWTDGEESQRAPSERTLSEYTTAHERNTSPPHIQKYRNDRSLNAGPKNLGPTYGPPTRIPPRAPSALSYEHGGDTGSDIYVTSAAYNAARAPSEYSRYTHRSHAQGPRSLYSVASSTKTGRSNRSRRAGARIEAMSAPNPFCPNVKGVCCLMLLLNLGLILVTLGFVIVIQFIEPLFVWILGLIFLIFGFATLIGSMIYCVVVCRDAKTPSQLRNEDLYWTRYWQKNIGYTPHEINYKADRYNNDAFENDRYSVSKISGKYSDRESNRY